MIYWERLLHSALGLPLREQVQSRPLWEFTLTTSWWGCWSGKSWHHADEKDRIWDWIQDFLPGVEKRWRHHDAILWCRWQWFWTKSTWCVNQLAHHEKDAGLIMTKGFCHQKLWFSAPGSPHKVSLSISHLPPDIHKSDSIGGDWKWESWSCLRLVGDVPIICICFIFWEEKSQIRRLRWL